MLLLRNRKCAYNGLPSEEQPLDLLDKRSQLRTGLCAAPTKGRTLLLDEQDVPMIAKEITASYKAGMESERRFFMQMLAPIFTAFERAEQDKQAKVPSSLTAAIVAARAQCVMSTPNMRERLALVRPEHDLDVYGRPLKPGG